MRTLNLWLTILSESLLYTLVLSRGSSTFGPYRIKEEIPPPLGWAKHSLPPSDHIITLRVGLPQQNFHVLVGHLDEISNPDHERYGKHLSKIQVEELVSPHPDSLEAVNAWLTTFGFRKEELDRSPASDWIILTIPINKAEELLNTTYHIWKSTYSEDYVVRTTSYSLPIDLHRHVDVIQPTTMFGRPTRQKSTIARIEFESARHSTKFKNDKKLTPTSDAVDPSCDSLITISCLRQLYNFEGYVPVELGNSIAVTGYLDQYANLLDLQTFYADQRPDALSSSYSFVSVAGGKNDQNPAEAGDEANLDTQYAFGLTYPIPATFYSTGGSPPIIPSKRLTANTNEPYAEWLDYVLGQSNPPFTISTSYGDDEQTVPESYARRVCAGFAQLGARGTSVIFSSGDWGVGDGIADPMTQECISNDGRNTTKFLPVFPASCPYVTSVGGTSGTNPEVAVRSFPSGGGFSEYFPRPKYQDFAVSRYLSMLPNNVYSGLYNSAGRGIPDVAARADHYLVWIGGRRATIGGTSASAPAFAGIVTLLNDARFKANLTSLGFLNPLLYKKGLPGFNDVLTGHNQGCGTQGFNATEGWDPVTGLGTPNFGKLEEIVTS